MFFFVFNKNIFNYILVKIYTKYIFIIGEYKQFIYQYKNYFKKSIKLKLNYILI